MTNAEIFGKISAHMVEGMMFHEKMADYYDFLGLDGYRCCHKWHYLMETINRSALHQFYISHYNMLLKDEIVDSDVELIPVSWWKVTRLDVDPATKKNGVKTGVSEWKSWEEHTKKLYSELHKELVNSGDMLAASFLMDIIKDVDKEIRSAEKKMMQLNSVAYDMVYIYDEQRRVLKKYESLSSERFRDILGGC